MGYGDIVPKSPLGRTMAATLMIGGLILLSLLTASIINYLTELSKARHHNTSGPLMEELKAKLDRLDQLSGDELASLKGSVAALVDRRLQTGLPATPATPPRSGGTGETGA